MKDWQLRLDSWPAKMKKVRLTITGIGRLQKKTIGKLAPLIK